MRHFTCLAILCLALGFSVARAEKPARELTIMSYNIQNGIGMDKVMDYARTASVIIREAPDVCAIQEIDSITGRSQRRDLLGELAELTGMHATYAKAINYDGGAYGIGLLSKEKPLSVKRIPLPGREEPRVALVTEFEHYYLIGTHLTLTRQDQFTSVRMLDSIAAELICKKPVFLAGDLNIRPQSDQLKQLAETYTVLTDTTQMTFPAGTPRSCIDYILSYKSDRWFTRTLSRAVVDAPEESDHRPVIAKVRYGSILRTDPYLQNPVDNGMTVTWLTNTPAYSYVEYGTDTANLTMARTLVDGQAMAGNTLNKIRLDDLRPGQKYYYRVVSRELLYYGGYQKIFGGTSVSPFYTFELPPAGQKDFTAVIFNDIHQNRQTIDTLYSVVKNIPYDFVVFNGDCIDDPGSQAQAVASMSYYNEKVGAENVPVFYLRGNHEIRNSYSIGLRELFDYVGDKTYGAFNWGDNRIVMLDCGEDKPDDHWVYYGFNDFEGLRNDQVGFLRTELVSKAFKKAGKRILIHHIPIYSPTIDYNPCLDLWHPLLKKAPFDVALNGHTHRYAYHPKGELDNNFPVVIGGGNRPERATVMVLSRKGDVMTLTVFDVAGQEMLKLDL